MKTAAIELQHQLGTSWWGKRQRNLLAKVLAPLANAKIGSLTVTLPNKSQLSFGDQHDKRLAPSVILNNWKGLRKAFSGGSVGWSEAYMDGDWDCPNLAELVEWIVVNEEHFGDMLASGKTKQWLQRLQHRRNANNKRGSKRNIAYHYDLGNHFYRHWLDDSMTYSSALFDEGIDDLRSAQHRKYQRLIDELAVQSGDRVLEVGCGWGGFAEQLCQQKDASLHGITLSKEQLSYARQRIADAGLSDRAKFSLTDYRDTRDQYDHIVSIEMLEAVGEQYWPTYFDTLYARLKPGGRAAIQVITIEEKRFEGYRDNPDFIQRYIFPGGMLPSPDLFRSHASKAGFDVKSELPFGLSYAKTLAHWATAFNARWEDIVPLGFDQRFKRMWQYYLGYCEGGFRAGSIDVYQFVLEKPHCAP
ncbi:cyclopropane-fatty-acyl-phospholipid synthase family protein [uncultured Spongiibacter sp.]|uniref:SAM-dependent methyltransferase n=1 Tax=uncultured Spongiibacter sp. TaxID=870896 RepID=UPI00258401CF|nr:cyclopropane-fatty-acyl-phospholipid synthase family protein [uncultured Spongiibacter sp.]